MAAIRLTINGERWTLKFVRSITRDGEKCFGYCDYDKKEILVHRTLPPQKMADIIVHEMIHAAASNLDEEWVTDTATDIAAALYHPEVQERL